MSTDQQGTSPGQQDSFTTLGVGGRTSGQQGASERHETQQETGGGGGDGLARNQSGGTANAPTGTAVGDKQAGTEKQPGDSAMTNTARGAQDTRAAQAGGNDTGLGTPETGGNQSAEDLPPRK